MKALIICFLFCYGCAAGAATAGYAIKAGSADELSAPARKSLIEEVKTWVGENFQKK